MSKDKFTIGDTVTSSIHHKNRVADDMDFVVTDIQGSRILCKSPSGLEVLLEAANLKLVKKGG